MFGENKLFYAGLALIQASVAAVCVWISKTPNETLDSYSTEELRNKAYQDDGRMTGWLQAGACWLGWKALKNTLKLFS